MSSRGDLLVRLWPILALLVLYLFGLLFLQARYGEHALLWWLNGHQNALANALFINFSWFGEWLVMSLVLLVLLLRRDWETLKTYLLALVLMVGVVQLLKHGFFNHSLRPVPYFAAQGQMLHVPHGVKVHHLGNFPSGHSAASAVAMLALALTLKNRWGQALCGLLALAVALSRVYLAQHFANDTAAGILIAMVAVAVAFYSVEPLSASIALSVRRARAR